MSTLKNKIDFALVFSVKNANPNGDPLDETDREWIIAVTAKCPMYA